MIVVSLAFSWTVVIQTDATIKHDTRIRSLSGLWLRVLGSKFHFWLACLIMFIQIGADVSYLMFNGVQFDQIVWQMTQDSICGHSKTYISIATLLMIPVWWIKNLRDLSYVSFFVLIGEFTTIATIIYYSIVAIMNTSQINQVIYK